MMTKVSYRDPATPLTLGQAELRRLVLKQITAHPDTFDMMTWEMETACGTTRCLAGWAEFFSFGEIPDEEEDDDFVQKGIILLGLTRQEYCGTGFSPLFYDRDDNAVVRLKAITPP